MLRGIGAGFRLAGKCKKKWLWQESVNNPDLPLCAALLDGCHEVTVALAWIVTTRFDGFAMRLVEFFCFVNQ